MARYRQHTVTINENASLSEALELGTLNVVGIVPGTWTSAAITFQVSVDGVKFADLYDESSSEVTISAATHEDRAYEAPPGLSGWHSIKVRSGTSGTPVNQAQTVTVSVLVFG